MAVKFIIPFWKMKKWAFFQSDHLKNAIFGWVQAVAMV